MANSTIDVQSPSAHSDRALRLALAAAQTAIDNRGRDLVILDMRAITPVFDYFVLATGTSLRQLHAMSEEIDHKLEDELGDHRMGVEGYQSGRWVLLDYGDVVIHLFDAEARQYYALEDLWCQAKRVPFEPAGNGTETINAATINSTVRTSTEDSDNGSTTDRSEMGS